MAQETPKAAPPQAVADSGVADIVVTAQKRSESLSRVGLTVSAFGQETLRTKQISNVADLTRVVPSLSVATSQANTPVYTLRGVGFYENTLGSYPAVSVYVDEVPLPLPVLTTQAGLDLERIEVLKGPQGTLFGQNATGGAINFIAAKPTKDFAAGFDVSYGRFNTIDATGFVSGPITSTLGFRLAVKGVHGDDWQKSYSRDDTLGKARTVAGRLLLQWEPTAGARFLLNLNADQDKSDPQATQYIEFAPQGPVIFPRLAAVPLPELGPRVADWGADTRPRGNDRKYQASLRGDVDITNDLILTSISAYVRFKRNQIVDPDGIALKDYWYDTTGNIRSFSQELRLSNGSAKSFRWIVGGNYERTHFDENNLLHFEDSTVASGIGLWLSNGYNTQQKMTNVAGFANGEYDVTSKITVKAGGRYTDNKRVTAECTQDIDGLGGLANFFTGLSNGLRAAQGLGPLPAIPIGGCVNMDNISRDASGRIPYTPGRYFDTFKEHNFSWRVGLDYKPTSDLLFYVNIAKGYKAGGHPATTAATNIQFLPVKQEALLDYEAGFKSQLFDRKVALTGAVFYYDYSNKQLRTKIVDPVFNLLDAVRNVPKSSVRGAEMSLTANPARGLTIGGAVTYLDSKIDRFSGYNGQSQFVNFKGTQIPFAPKWSGSASVAYKTPVSERLSAFGGVDMNFNSSTYSTVGTDSYARLNSYALFDVRAGLSTADEKIRFTVWGRNIFNKYYWTNAIAVYDTRVRYAGRPATYGITLGYRM